MKERKSIEKKKEKEKKFGFSNIISGVRSRIFGSKVQSKTNSKNNNVLNPLHPQENNTNKATLLKMHKVPLLKSKGFYIENNNNNASSKIVPLNTSNNHSNRKNSTGKNNGNKGK